MDIKPNVLRIIADNCESLDAAEITEESNFMEDLDFSSLEFFSVITELEDTFDIKITERELQNLPTVGTVIELISQKKGN